jgi:predicted transcriptional regulator
MIKQLIDLVTDVSQQQIEEQEDLKRYASSHLGAASAPLKYSPTTRMSSCSSTSTYQMRESYRKIFPTPPKTSKNC